MGKKSEWKILALSLKGITRSQRLNAMRRQQKHRDTWVRSPMQWNKDKNAGFTKDDKPWIPVAKNYVNINVDVQKGIDKSHLEIHRQLLKMRKHNAIMESDAHSMEIKALGENSFAFKR